MELAQGSRLANRFKVLACLGTGALGHVFLAEDAFVDDRKVAIKIISPERFSRERLGERLKAEVARAAKVSDESLVQVYEVIDQADFKALSMEYIEGSDLKSVLETRSFSTLEAVAILWQLTRALEVLHKNGLVHLALKTSSVLFSSDGKVKLGDIALLPVRTFDADGNLLLQRGEGQYLSPEYLRTGNLEPKVDLYALGVIGIELLNSFTSNRKSEEPLQLSSESQVIAEPDARKILSEVLSQATEANPERRFQDASDFRRALERVSADITYVPPCNPWIFVLGMFLFCEVVLVGIAYFFS